MCTRDLKICGVMVCVCARVCKFVFTYTHLFLITLLLMGVGGILTQINVLSVQPDHKLVSEKQSHISLCPFLVGNIHTLAPCPDLLPCTAAPGTRTLIRTDTEIISGS